MSPLLAVLIYAASSLAALTGSIPEGASAIVSRVTVPALPGPLLGGWATYYRDPKQPADARYAAAGPLLQAVLGDFRGKLIRVTAGERSTIVRVIDVCACGDRQGKPTIIDLSPAAFSDLAPLDAGIVAVEIEPVTIRPPDTSTEP